MSSPKVWNHNALAHDLAVHLRAMTDRMVWEDFQLGQAHSCRPDVVTIDRSYRVRLVAYEVKVNLSDFRRDVAEGKWTKYADVAHAVYFAVPQGLITTKDVPAGAGLYIRTEAGWKAVRKAPPTPKPAWGSDLWMKLLMDGIDRERDRAIGAQDRIKWVDTYKQAEQARKAGGEELARALRDSASYITAVAAKRVQVEAELALLEERAKKAYDRSRADAESLRRDAQHVVADLAVALGLPAQSSMWECSAAARAWHKRLSEKGEIAHLRAQLEAIKQAIRSAEPPALACDDNPETPT